MASPKYAWVVAICCFFAGIVTMGAIGGFGYVMTGMAEEFGVTLGDLAIINSIYTLCSNGLAFVAGLIADKIGPRFTMGFGMLINGAMILCAGTLGTNLGLLIAFIAIAGAGASGLVGSVMPKLIASWFAPNNRGKANLLYVLGPSVTGAIYGLILPVILITYGWRMDFIVIGIINCVVAVLFLLLCRNTPRDMGTWAFGYTEEEATLLVEAEDAARVDVDTKAMLVKVLKYPTTWCFGIAYACYMVYFMVGNAYGTPALMTVGIDPVFVGQMNSVTMISVIFSQFLWAALSDRFLSRKTILLVICLIYSCITIAFYFFLRDIQATGFGGGDIPMIWTFMILNAIFMGQGALINTINAEVFPPSMRQVGPAVVATICLLGASGGPLLAGAVINANGDDPLWYLWIVAIASALSAILIQIFTPATGGKHGDPRAIQEAEEQLGEAAVREAVTSTEVD